MKTVIRTSLAALALAGASSAATVSLVTITNPEEVTGGQTDSVSQILAGQTVYVGIPFAAGSWPSSEATDYFEVSTFLLATGGTSTASFSFYTATDSGTELTGITQLSNITTGSVNVAQEVSGVPSDSGNTAIAGVTAQLEYANATGNPFASIGAGVIWLGITNTGSNTINYYTGFPGLPSGFGTPAPVYSFSGPFDSEQSGLTPDSYVYEGGVLVDGGQNQYVHPYLSITAETIPVPEPGVAGLAGLAGFLLIRRRRFP